MMNKTSDSSASSRNPDFGVTDSLWQPSWWQWLISALSGTVETEKQIAWLEKHSEEMRKTEEEKQTQHDLRLNELKKENARLAELESKLDAVL